MIKAHIEVTMFGRFISLLFTDTDKAIEYKDILALNDCSCSLFIH